MGDPVYLDWPNHSLKLFARVEHKNRDTHSKIKRQSHFDWMAAAEVSKAKSIGAQAFDRVN